MAFAIIRQCAQCGAPVEFLETDRLLHCPFCSVKSLVATQELCRYLLPPRIAADINCIHAPYLRFRGSIFTCTENGVEPVFADLTHLGTPLTVLPQTLGLRPQAMKLRFAEPANGAIFLKNFLSIKDAVNRTGIHASTKNGADISFQAFIGETMSLIYLPLTKKNGILYDAITDDPLARLPTTHDILAPVMDHRAEWQLRLTPTLCPQCGADLEAQRDSVVLVCRNCETLWEHAENGFTAVKHHVYHGVTESASTSLPFWQIVFESPTLGLARFADYLRFTNHPAALHKRNQDSVIHLWCPAFKIKPKTLLQLATSLTLSQPRSAVSTEALPRTFHPITLPRTEAMQVAKPLLANTGKQKKKIMPLLADAEIHFKESTLVFLPFRSATHDFICEAYNALAINRKALEYGRVL